MRLIDDLSDLCNNVCLEPVYTGKRKDECIKRFKKEFALKEPPNCGAKMKGESECSS